MRNRAIAYIHMSNPIFSNNGSLHEASLQMLTEKLMNSSLPGFDYIEFKQAVINLAKMNMDQATAFKSAYVTAATLGLTKEKLVETAAHYKSVLVNEKNHFDASLQRQQDQKIATRLKEIAELKRQIAEKTELIKKLESEIGTANQTVREADLEIESASEKIEAAKNNFLGAYNSVLVQIDGDIEAITRYL